MQLQHRPHFGLKGKELVSVDLRKCAAVLTRQNRRQLVEVTNEKQLFLRLEVEQRLCHIFKDVNPAHGYFVDDDDISFGDGLQLLLLVATLALLKNPRRNFEYSVNGAASDVE